ncbi:class V chitinase CHIT5a-like [Rhododendron vialii]|uniref:class V chitinase CHIT5a-like n=1 Tax=Rhododendron vialii TaxID=182163 RepID=UPI00265EA701|nr:class V chitinase CHIT5a-like [Rhododendron vialii]
MAVKGGYWPSWVSDFRGIDSRLFTHIYYAFVVPDHTFKLDLSGSRLGDFISAVRPAKAILSVGGERADPKRFSDIVSNKSSRKIFIDSSIEVARAFGFDGVDLDWEFPQDHDVKNLGDLLHEWRAAVQREATVTSRNALLLTAAVPFSANSNGSFPVDSLKQNLDWINAMCYNYRGSWDNFTGAHAALFDPINKSEYTTDMGLQSWIRAGIPPSKLVMGLPLYGRTWTLENPGSHGIGAAARGIGPGDGGTMTYAEIMRFNRQHSVREIYDQDTVSAYSYAGTAWIGYDNVKSTTTKIQYAQRLGLRGYFFWQIAGDHEGTISRAASNSWS